MKKHLLLDSNLVQEALPILEDWGVDLETVVKMTLKRIVRDNSIAFLTAKTEVPVMNTPIQNTAADSENGRLGKSQAISLFEAQGFRFSRNVTFASKNRGAENYWANPYFFALDNDWYLILNDWKKRELHLFKIPAKTIHHGDMVPRVDQPEKIDLQIAYEDPAFTDNRSRVQFAGYRVKSLQY